MFHLSNSRWGMVPQQRPDVPPGLAPLHFPGLLLGGCNVSNDVSNRLEVALRPGVRARVEQAAQDVREGRPPAGRAAGDEGEEGVEGEGPRVLAAEER
jgi:hypothetical protein